MCGLAGVSLLSVFQIGIVPKWWWEIAAISQAQIFTPILSTWGSPLAVDLFPWEKETMFSKISGWKIVLYVNIGTQFNLTGMAVSDIG